MSPKILLRNVIQTDLPIFFQQQLNPKANYMAAFTAKNPADQTAFSAHWARILGDEDNITKTIVVDGQVAGYVASYEEEAGRTEVTYWLGKDFWGRGVATIALLEFLNVFKTRPVYARVAADNGASKKVLEKAGFTVCGSDRGFANARNAEIEEMVLELR